MIVVRHTLSNHPLKCACHWWQAIFIKIISHLSTQATYPNLTRTQQTYNTQSLTRNVALINHNLITEITHGHMCTELSDAKIRIPKCLLFTYGNILNTFGSPIIINMNLIISFENDQLYIIFLHSISMVTLRPMQLWTLWLITNLSALWHGQYESIEINTRSHSATGDTRAAQTKT